MKGSTPTVYLASPVFREIADNPRVSVKYKFLINKVWSNLNTAASVIVADSRFPSEEEMQQRGRRRTRRTSSAATSATRSPRRSSRIPSVKAVSTSNVGWNHIHLHPGVIVTNTPGVLAGTTADYTLSLILANLRNIVGLNQYVWSGQWKPGEKWDLDRHITKNTENLTYGILGLGEIGREVVHRVAPWGIHIAYHDIFQSAEMEEKYPNLDLLRGRRAALQDRRHPLDPHPAGREHPAFRRRAPAAADAAARAAGEHGARRASSTSRPSSGCSRARRSRIHLAFDVYEEEPIPASMLDRVPPDQRRAAGPAVHLHAPQRHGRRRHAGAHGRHHARQPQRPGALHVGARHQGAQPDPAAGSSSRRSRGCWTTTASSGGGRGNRAGEDRSSAERRRPRGSLRAAFRLLSAGVPADGPGRKAKPRSPAGAPAAPARWCGAARCG
ncbi:MAG: hypothetical protein MZV70_48555 [Desulfobacterales bacterium]|nr:hypothetical protein [Desulfobacterales bacterium]